MKFLRLHPGQAGFTLMELLIVVALIMILSAIGVGGYTASTAKSRDTQRKNDLNQIAKALESFNNDVGHYPIANNGKMKCYEKSGSSGTDVDCINGKLTFKLDGKVTSYMTIPTDPDSNQKYYYESEDGSSFALYVAIQNEDDRDLIKDGNGNIVTYGTNCGVLACNYKITETGLVKTNE